MKTADMRIVLTLTIILCVFLGSCKNKTPQQESTKLELIPIPLSKYKVNSNFDGKLRMGETVLVKNHPSNEDALIKMMFNYQQEYCTPIDSFSELYFIGFYKYTPETKQYLTKKVRSDGWGNSFELIDENKFEIGVIFISPNHEKSPNWIVDARLSRKYTYHGIEDYYCITVFLDSCATLVDNKIVLSKALP